MGNQSAKNKATMSYKAKPLGYNAKQIVDEAIMANQMCLNQLGAILENQLTTEGVLRAIGLAIKEASTVQGNLSKVRYMDK